MVVVLANIVDGTEPADTNGVGDVAVVVVIVIVLLLLFFVVSV